MPLTNCKIEWKHKWKKYNTLSAFVNENNIDQEVNANNISFTIKDTNLYVLVVTWSARDNQKPLKLPSRGFGRSVYWNEYRKKNNNSNNNNNNNTTNEFRYFLE